MSARHLACALGALSLVATAAPAGAATFLTAGTSSSCAENCFNNATGTYKVTWSAAELFGRVQSLKLDRKVLGDMQNYAFKVTFENAAGEKVGDWGSFMIAGLGGDQVNLFGPGFDWDAAGGDLVMKLTLAIPGKGGAGGGFFGIGGGAGRIALDTGGSSIAAEGSDTGALNDVVIHKDLLPGDDVPAAAAALVAPEPASWALMMVGFGAAGALLRRRRLEAVL